jgi:hypothetical protein
VFILVQVHDFGNGSLLRKPIAIRLLGRDVVIDLFPCNCKRLFGRLIWLQFDSIPLTSLTKKRLGRHYDVLCWLTLNPCREADKSSTQTESGTRASRGSDGRGVDIENGEHGEGS